MKRIIKRKPGTKKKPEKPSGCGCLEKVAEALKKQYGPTVSLDTKMEIKFATGEIRAVVPPLFFTYMKGKKKVRSHVAFNYCPYCGKEEAA